MGLPQWFAAGTDTTSALGATFVVDGGEMYIDVHRSRLLRDDGSSHADMEFGVKIGIGCVIILGFMVWWAWLAFENSIHPAAPRSVPYRSNSDSPLSKWREEVGRRYLEQCEVLDHNPGFSEFFNPLWTVEGGKFKPGCSQDIPSLAARSMPPLATRYWTAKDLLRARDESRNLFAGLQGGTSRNTRLGSGGGAKVNENRSGAEEFARMHERSGGATSSNLRYNGSRTINAYNVDRTFRLRSKSLPTPRYIDEEESDVSTPATPSMPPLTARKWAVKGLVQAKDEDKNLSASVKGGESCNEGLGSGLGGEINGTGSIGVEKLGRQYEGPGEVTPSNLRNRTYYGSEYTPNTTFGSGLRSPPIRGFGGEGMSDVGSLTDSNVPPLATRRWTAKNLIRTRDEERLLRVGTSCNEGLGSEGRLMVNGSEEGPGGVVQSKIKDSIPDSASDYTIDSTFESGLRSLPTRGLGYEVLEGTKRGGWEGDSKGSEEAHFR